MNRIWVVVVAFLMFFVAPSVSAAPIRHVAPAVDTHLAGNPFRPEDAHLWLPVLRATGSVQEAADAVVGSLTYYDLSALGDADRDGASDFLVVSRVHLLSNRTEDFNGDPDAVTITAISGASGKELWKRTLTEDQSWYMLGDIDLDGVNDPYIVRYNQTGTNDGIDGLVAGRSVSSYAYRNDYEILDGRTGADRFTRTTAGSIQFESIYASAPAAFVEQYKVTSSGGGPSAVAPGVVGVDFVRYYSNTTLTLVLAGVGFTQVYEYEYKPTVERLDPSGALAWRLAPTLQDSTLSSSTKSDLNGDGVPDYVFVGRPTRSVSTLAGTIALSNGQRLGTVLAYDGKSGAAMWSYDIPATEHDPTKASFSITNGGRSGPTSGSVLLRIAGPTFSQPDQYASTLRLLDGATGTPSASKTFVGKMVLAYVAGDIDHDGSDELAVSSMERSGSMPVNVVNVIAIGKSELAVTKRDFTPIWTRPDVSYRDPFFIMQPDVDGDAAPDVLIVTYDKNNATTDVVSSRDGTTLWNHTADRRTENVVVVPSVDGQPGGEVGVTEIEVPLDRLPSDAGVYDFNYAEYGATFSLRHGTDNRLVWSARVREPSKTGETLLSPFPRPLVAGDIDQDSVPDILYTLRSGTFYSIRCSDTCTYKIVGDDEPLVNLALVLSGADGSLLYAYPDNPNGLVVKQGPIRIPASPKIRADAADAKSPDVSLGALLVALAATSMLVRLNRKR